MFQSYRSMSTPQLQFTIAKEYYKILGVKANASKIEIKKQFFIQAKLYHPDILSSKLSAADSKQLQDKFRDINEAY